MPFSGASSLEGRVTWLLSSQKKFPASCSFTLGSATNMGRAPWAPEFKYVAGSEVPRRRQSQSLTLTQLC